ncbi:hypothetical protein PV10_03224 [Exophiala mesophila]|uniref:Uncharacterized protein n=1 Tax=Exophiala mesophila TaxID=212818 RepID=A0A0D2A9G5_EXOME|nr:uncharacterized protein PV10_03224 [Exophiala mesophila]KIV95593.1 hypothetical protein PV10_03224 [Exophiala mesophila]
MDKDVCGIFRTPSIPQPTWVLRPFEQMCDVHVDQSLGATCLHMYEKSKKRERKKEKRLHNPPAKIKNTDWPVLHCTACWSVGRMRELSIYLFGRCTVLCIIPLDTDRQTRTHYLSRTYTYSILYR